MNIQLINLEYETYNDPKYKNNYALEQIRKHHEALGDKVYSYREGVPLLIYDKTYVSSIFTWTKEKKEAQEILKYANDSWEFGGTGFDILKRLPCEIEQIKVNKNFGWTQRGCNNKCVFCVVHKKEGCAHEVGDLYDIWDGKSRRITLYDNNILQLPKHFLWICSQIRKEDIKVDWNQGLDIRLVNDDVAKELSTIKHAEYHFAFDNSSLDKIIAEKVEILKKYDINCSIFYMIVGIQDKKGKTAKEDIEDALYRLKLLKQLGQNAMVMRYRKVSDDQPETLINSETKNLYIPVANWGSVHSAFQSMDFYNDYLSKHERGMPYKQYFDEMGIAI
ncbi:MAG: hypothetical protein ACM3TR_10990 [Caulobacteraceae bacterium]